MSNKIKQIARRRRAVRRMARTLSVSLGSCLALNGHYYKRSAKVIHTPPGEALKADWQAIGTDMNRVYQAFESDIIN